MSRTETTTRLYGSTASSVAQRRALTRGDVPVAVYGLGKMGLPLATVYAAVTGNVTGVDIDESVVAAVNDGDCPVENEPGLDIALRRVVEDGDLTATTDLDAAADEAAVHVMLVPTLLEDDEPDLSALLTLTRDVARNLDPGDLVVVESTVPVGTCRTRLWPLLKRGTAPASQVGLAFCPERTMSGRALKDIRGAYPRIVGGVDEESSRVAELLYSQLTKNDVHVAADARTAECVKVFEGIYRDVNIALANELGSLARELGVDVHSVIELANTQPYCDIHTPGIGVGGHCIPVYPYFLLDSVDSSAPLIRMAREINDSMPHHAIQLLRDALDHRGTTIGGSRIAVLGVTYRPGVDEVRNSPAFPIVEELTEQGAAVHVVDPVCSDLSEFGGTPTTVEALADLELDAAILVTAHDEFGAIPWRRLDPMVVVDGRRALDLARTDHHVETIGDGRRS